MSLPGEDPLPLPLMSATNAQSKMAKDLSDWLNQDGPPRIKVVDLLDGMAVLGYKLAEDGSGVASIAYLREVAGPSSDAAPKN